MKESIVITVAIVIVIPILIVQYQNYKIDRELQEEKLKFIIKLNKDVVE